MDKSTHEIRLAHWRQIIEQCQSRPKKQTAKQWLEEHEISDKAYYYWLRKIRRTLYDQSVSSKTLPEVSQEQELSCNRRSVRVPLPAESDRVTEELDRIQVDPEQRLYIRIKAPDLFPIHDLRLSDIDLPVLNQIAEQVQRMEPEEARKFHEILLDKNWRGQNRVERIREILERFMEEEIEHKMEPMKMDMRQI